MTRPGTPGGNLARATAEVAAAAVAAVAVAAAGVVAAAVAAADMSSLWRGRGGRLDRVDAAVAGLELLPAVWKTCPWQPRPLIETGLRQWLRCCGPALRDGKAIGMPSRAVDEAWHGLILCTVRYSEFCAAAYGRFLHHNPVDGAPPGLLEVTGPMDEQLRRTVIAWSLVAKPGEQCVLWDVDERVGVDHPWGLPAPRVAQIQAAIASLAPT